MEELKTVSACRRSSVAAQGLVFQPPGRSEMLLLQRLCALSGLIPTSRRDFWCLRTVVSQPFSFRCRLCISDLSLRPVSLLRRKSLAGSLGGGPAIAPQLPTALCCPQQMAVTLPAQRPKGPVVAWVLAVVFWPALFPLVQQANHCQVNLPEISFHMRVSSVAMVKFIDWRQVTWVQFQLCCLLTV